MIAKVALALVFTVAAAGSSLAQSALDDRAYWAEAFETGRAYAADMTLVAYCFRKDPETAAVVYLSVIGDMTRIVELSRQGAVSVRQAAGFVHAVLDATRFAPPDAVDAALEKACVERNVQQAYFGLQPIAMPLSMRPPFKRK